MIANLIKSCVNNATHYLDRIYTNIYIEIRVFTVCIQRRPGKLCLNLACVYFPAAEAENISSANHEMRAKSKGSLAEDFFGAVSQLFKLPTAAVWRCSKLLTSACSCGLAVISLSAAQVAPSRHIG